MSAKHASPASTRSQYRVFDFDDNTVSIDAAELGVQKVLEKPGDVGFTVVAAAGDVARVAAAAGLARFGLGDSVALILRGEFFADPNGAPTGVAQHPKEVTLTPEWKISPHFILGGDLRVDSPDRDVFEKSAGAGLTRTQPTIKVDAIYVFRKE